MSLTKVHNRMVQNGEINVIDYGADPTGIADSTAAIQLALDTRNNVFIPAGTYKITATLEPYRGQIIRGEGNVERSLQSTEPASTLSVATDVTAFDTVPNTAYACSIKNLYIIAEDQTHGSGKYGIKIGTKGSSGGSSQGIKCLIEDVLCRGFDICFGSYGYGWEVTFNRCVADYHRSIGFEFADAFTVVSANDCTAMLGGVAYGTDSAQLAIGMVFEGGTSALGDQVHITMPRLENNLDGGIKISGNAKIFIDSFYGEGNRFYDIFTTGTFEGQVVVSGGVFIHENDGANTIAAVRNTSSNKCFIRVTGAKFGLGNSTTNTTSAGFYYGESTAPMVIIEGLNVEGDVSEMSSGNKKVVYLSQGGRYAPSEFSVADLPNVKFYRSGTSHVAHVYNATPASLLISDGTNTFDMLTDNSLAFSGGNIYSYDLGTTTWNIIAP